MRAFRRMAWCVVILNGAILAESVHAEVFVRFKMVEPAKAGYYVRVGGYIHNANWILRSMVWPESADKYAFKRAKAGTPTAWLNLKELEYGGARLHGRLHRSGGGAEFPNITADFIADPPSPRRKVIIDLATSPDGKSIVKSFEESYTGSLTSFLVSPDLVNDAADLELASQMSERHVRWATEATKGEAAGPQKLFLETSFWSPQRPELNLREAEVLRLLGFNVVGNQQPEVLENYPFNVYSSVGARLDPVATREDCQKEVERYVKGLEPVRGRLRQVVFNDEIRAAACADGTNNLSPVVLDRFRNWLKGRGVTPKFLGVRDLTGVAPMDRPGPDISGQSTKASDIADRYMRRLYYLSCRFRQESTTDRLKWSTEAAHELFGRNAQTHTLPADHPFFGGSGMGYGKTADWGEFLSCDWFDLARRGAVDSLGIEDWLGLQYMYGPNYTWEGFQLLSFMADIFRSAAKSDGRDEMPMMVWITPGNETNVRLKAASCLAHGVKSFYLWVYGPTCVSTENYWADLRGEYDGIAALSRVLAKGEDLIKPGRLRPARVALLYSISSDLWQPLGYVHMLERRLTYFSLIHDQYPVDLLTEEDVIAGRLANYEVLYVTDPCVANGAARKIAQWVHAGGLLYGSCAAGMRDEYNEPASRLSAVFGLRPQLTITQIPGSYGVRGSLNAIDEIDRVHMKNYGETSGFGVLGVKAGITPTGTARVVGTYNDGEAAVVENVYGKGCTRYFANCPATSYAKDARFVKDDLKEKWPALQRGLINGLVRESRVKRPVELSSPVVEAGLYDSPGGLALVLANYTYEPIPDLQVRVRHARGVRTVDSVERGALPFNTEKDGTVKFNVSLGLSDLILLRRQGGKTR